MSDPFSVRERASNLERMAARPLDVLVIGGGIVGAWIALTAAMRGLRTGLVEKRDWASGTSGKTSRLIHGGLRYLQQYRIRMVRQASRERDILLRIAPNLVKPHTFLIPAYRDRGTEAWQLRVGLWLYDILSGDKVLSRRRWLTPGQAHALEPHLQERGMVGGALYSDAMAPDARLVLAVVRTAAEAGTLVANYARAVEVLKDEAGRAYGARVRDEETGRVWLVVARHVVNATGVWVPHLLARPRRGLRLRPTKGIHVLVPRDRIGHERAIVVPAPDRRTVFVLPWGRLSLIGTTDTAYRGDPELVEPDAADVDYLLGAVNRGFPEARLTREDVVSAYAGLRPLIDTGETKESDISRTHRIFVGPDGVISVAGGKLTTARAMAEDVLRRIERRRLLRRRRRGKADTRVVRLVDSLPPDATTDLPGAVAHCARNEMALHLDDVLVRRLGVFYELSDQGLGLASQVAEVLLGELGWDATKREAEVARYEALVEASRRWRQGTSGG